MATTLLNDYTTALDTSIRPQDDFYHYVNHTWISTNPIPASEMRWGSFNVLRDESLEDMRRIYEALSKRSDLESGSIEQQASDLYYTGMNVDLFESQHLSLVDDYLKKVDAVHDIHQFMNVMGELDRVGVQGIWSSAIEVDDEDSERQLFHVRQASLTLPSREYYLEDNEKMQGVRKEYESHIHNVHAHFPALASTANALWDAIWSLELALATVSRSPSELRDVKKNYNKRTFDSLKQEYDAIDWEQYAYGLKWSPKSDLSVDQPEYFAFLQKELASRTLEDWKIYLKWRFVSTYYGSINETYAKLRFEFFGKVLSGTKEPLPLWKRVAASINSAIGEGVGRLYAEKHFPESSKQQVLSIVEDVRAVYAKRISGLDWMSDATKAEALKKLANIKVLIGYPDVFRDFSAIHIDRTSYIANKIAAREFDTDYHLKKLNEKTSRDEWHMYPQTVNAYNDPQRLVICFPAAILQKPFFDPGAHLAENLSGIGMVIGHELTHSFDDQGCQFDAEGNARTWQSEQERIAFESRADIVVKQADAFEVLPGLKMRGKLVIGESIADLGGIELSYQVLREKTKDMSEIVKDGHTVSELFFLHYGETWRVNTREEAVRELTISDPHPSEIFRVNGIISHVQAFYDTFHVQEGDLLYREPLERASIW